MPYWLYKLLDKLITWLESKLYDENYYEADSERTALKIKVEELEREIEYLKERDEY